MPIWAKPPIGTAALSMGSRLSSYAMMGWTLHPWVEIRRERHFGDRALRCFADSPGSVYESVASVYEAYPDAEALLCGYERLTYRELAERAGRVSTALA